MLTKRNVLLLSNKLFAFLLTVFATSVFATSVALAQSNWPMAGGPEGRWTVSGPQPPLNFSVRTNQNIQWKTTLPEGGQSGITIFDDMVFLSV